LIGNGLAVLLEGGWERGGGRGRMDPWGVVNGLRDGPLADEVDEWGAAGEDSSRVHCDGLR
jgi:hypothetical protein